MNTRVCEGCGKECDIRFKFCPECGLGFEDLTKRDKVHHMNRAAIIAPIFPGAICALATMQPGDKWYYYPLISLMFGLFFAIGEVVANMLIRKYKSNWLCYLGEMVAAVAVAYFVYIAFSGEFFSVFDAL